MLSGKLICDAKFEGVVCPVLQPVSAITSERFRAEQGTTSFVSLIQPVCHLRFAMAGKAQQGMSPACRHHKNRV